MKTLRLQPFYCTTEEGERLFVLSVCLLRQQYLSHHLLTKHRANLQLLRIQPSKHQNYHS